MNAGFFDGPRMPSLASYCSSPNCGTGSPCEQCRLDDGIACDACGEPATVLVEDGTPSKLPLCATCEAEDAAGKGGEWVRFSRIGDPTELLGRNPGGWGCTFGNGTPGECGKPARYGKGDCYGACESHAVALGAAGKVGAL